MNSSYKAKDKNKFIDEVTNIYSRALKESSKEESNVLSLQKLNKKHDHSYVSSNSNSEMSKNKKILRSLTFDNLDSINIDFELLKNIEDLNFSAESTCNSFNSMLCDPILSKNINAVDDVLKLMVVGEQSIGKSFLINKMLDDKADKSYVHTSSFEIKKKNIKLIEKHIRLEFWDTNIDILNSEICQGKFSFFYKK
jgi:hypothetical protein